MTVSGKLLSPVAPWSYTLSTGGVVRWSPSCSRIKDQSVSEVL